MNDVIITKTTGGLGRRSPNGDMICGLIANGTTSTNGAALDTPYRFTSFADAYAVLSDELTDVAPVNATNLLVIEHVREYFRINPSGDLRLMLVAETTNLKDMVDPVNENTASKLLTSQGGEIRMLGVAFDIDDTTTDGWGFLDKGVASDTADEVIAKAQELASAEAAAHRPVEIFVEGWNYTVDSDKDYDFRGNNAPNVSVIVGQSKGQADLTPRYAALGTMLGVYSRAAVNESGAWVQKNNLTGGSLTDAAISGTSISELTDSVLNTVDDNGGVFFRSITGISGFYFNDSHTCISDTDDFAYIESNRTMNKAIRNIRTALLPSLNAPILVDPETGQLPPEVVKADEAIARRALVEMLNNGEVSGVDVYMDPTQNVIATSERRIKFSIVPTGTGRTISVEIGFSNPNNN
jgi:hypothetical protein